MFDLCSILFVLFIFIVLPEIDAKNTREYEKAAKEEHRKVAEGTAAINRIELKINADTLIIDRKWKTIEQVYVNRDGKRKTSKHKVRCGVDSVLDKIQSEHLIEKIETRYTADESGIKDEYRLVIGYEYWTYGPMVWFFESSNVPEGLRNLIDTLFDYVKLQGVEIQFLNKKNEQSNQERTYKFCSVVFDEFGQKYTYLTYDDSIRVGSYVWVPVGSYMEHAKARVVDVVYRTAEDAPYPIERTKHIIRECTFEELPKDVQERIKERNDPSNYYDWGVSADDSGGE